MHKARTSILIFFIGRIVLVIGSEIESRHVFGIFRCGTHYGTPAPDAEFLCVISGNDAEDGGKFNLIFASVGCCPCQALEVAAVNRSEFQGIPVGTVCLIFRKDVVCIRLVHEEQSPCLVLFE